MYVYKLSKVTMENISCLNDFSRRFAYFSIIWIIYVIYIKFVYKRINLFVVNIALGNSVLDYARNMEYVNY